MPKVFISPKYAHTITELLEDMSSLRMEKESIEMKLKDKRVEIIEFLVNMEAYDLLNINYRAVHNFVRSNKHKTR